MTRLNFTWAGPKTIPGNKFCGMDTMGACLTHLKYPKQEIIFWCLESEKAKFESHFNDFLGPEHQVQVKAIEPFIALKEGVDSEYYRFVEALKKRAETTPERAVHEWILIKESFVYWAAQYIEQDREAFLDSSITPDDAVMQVNDLLFDGLADESAVPAVENPPGSGRFSPDPWLMLVTKSDKERTERFTAYFNKPGDYTVKMYMTMDDVNLLSSENWHVPQTQRNNICDLFATVSDSVAKISTAQSEDGVRITAAGVQKFYLNSHRIDEIDLFNGYQPQRPFHEVCHPIFCYVRHGATKELEYLLQQGNINPTDKLEYADIDDLKQEQLSLLDFTERKLIQLKELLDQYAEDGRRAEKIIKPQYNVDITIPDTKPVWEGRLQCRKDLIAQGHEALNQVTDTEWLFQWMVLKSFKTEYPEIKAQYHNAAVQYGMLLAHEKQADGLLKILDKGLPLSNLTASLSAFLNRKINAFNAIGTGDFMTSLNRLCDYVFPTHQFKQRSFKTVEQLTETLAIGGETGVLRLIVNLLLKQGPICDLNKSAYIKSVLDYSNPIKIKEAPMLETEEAIIIRPFFRPPSAIKTIVMFLDEIIANTSMAVGSESSEKSERPESRSVLL